MKKSRLRILNSQVGSSPFPPFTFISWLFVYGYSGWLVGEIIGFPYLLAAVAVVVGFFPAMKWMLTSLVTSEPSFLDFGSIIVAILLVILPRNPAAWFGAVTSLLTISLFGYVIVKNKLSKMYSESKKCNTPLHLAVMDGRKEIVETLIEKGADVNLADYLGNTPLHRASYIGNKDTVKLLIAGGADVNATDNNGNTPLHSASKHGRENIVELLIESSDVVNTTK